MTGPDWEDRSLDDADVSGLFCGLLVRHAMPCRAMPSNVKCDDKDRPRLAGAQDLQRIALHCRGFLASRFASLELVRQG